MKRDYTALESAVTNLKNNGYTCSSMQRRHQLDRIQGMVSVLRSEGIKESALKKIFHDLDHATKEYIFTPPDEDDDDLSEACCASD